MASCNTIDIISFIEGEDPGGRTAAHLEVCPRCREELNAYKKLLTSMVAARAYDRHPSRQREETIDPPLSPDPLPPHILQKVADRKREWLTARAKKVLDFHPSRKGEDQTARLRRLLKESDDSLPLAAFPDDLADRDPDEDNDK